MPDRLGIDVVSYNRWVQRFDDYMEHCLYDASTGFYQTRGMAGRREGDFITSPEVGPLFGYVLFGWARGIWESLGRPDQFRFVEAAAGRGALAASFLSAVKDNGPDPFVSALVYETVEVSDELRAQQFELLGDRITIHRELPERVEVGVIVANELLDNLPFRTLCARADSYDEVFLDDGVEVLKPTDPPAISVTDLPDGFRFPLQEKAAAWVEGARSALVSGSVLVFDYGVRNISELAGRDWLRTYRSHQRGSNPYVDPGSCDITADVCFDQLADPTSLTVQSEWLSANGIDQLVEEGKQIWKERAAIGDLAAIKARSRVSESEALLDSHGLGGFLVAEWKS